LITSPLSLLASASPHSFSTAFLSSSHSHGSLPQSGHFSSFFSSYLASSYLIKLRDLR
jgi:hypothetical protein